jgi:DNA-binding response OmpR family regulator
VALLLLLHYQLLPLFNLVEAYGMNNRQKTVLIADDDVDLLQLVKMQLQRAGFNVQLSVNGNGITKMAAETHPDVILLDITMDGISGGDICKKLKSDNATSSIPIIMFSANENIEQIVHSCGANDFVKKPFSLQLMKDKIMHIVEA